MGRPGKYGKAMPTWRWPRVPDAKCHCCGEPGATDVDHVHGVCAHPDSYGCDACYRGMACRRCNVELGRQDAMERQWQATFSREPRRRSDRAR
jgi:hypothetical protein